MANQPNNPAVEAVDLTRSLPLGNAQVPILNGVSLTVEHGEWVALTGPSGSGKSTLLGLMAGLDTPTSGRIVLDGVDITRLGESQLAAIRNQKVGVVFQSFNLIPSLTAQENVEVPLYVNPDRKRIRERAGEMLELVGLGGAARRPADGRGGGGRAQSLVAAMPKGLRISLVVLGGIVVLASSAFVALSLLNPNLEAFVGLRLPGVSSVSANKKQAVTYGVVRATEIPAANPDVVGRLEARQDNSLMVRPDSKGAPAPLVEVVITGQTRLYRNATGDPPGLGVRTPAPSGATLQMVLEPYTIDQIATGDSIIAWGERRGDRLVAEVVMVERQ